MPVVFHSAIPIVSRMFVEFMLLDRQRSRYYRQSKLKKKVPTFVGRDYVLDVKTDNKQSIMSSSDMLF